MNPFSLIFFRIQPRPFTFEWKERGTGGGVGRGRGGRVGGKQDNEVVLVGCITSTQQAKCVSDNCTCCHTEEDNNNDDERISRALFHVKHAQLR